MPVSMKQGKNLITGWLTQHAAKISSVVDFGAGAGWYGKTIREIAPSANLIAVEIWEPYIKKYELEKIYNEVIVADALSVRFDFFDLAIFGDVLEHMTKEKARALIEQTREKATYIIVSIPHGSMPQGPVFGNEFESHVSTWEWEELCELFKDFEIKEKFLQIAVFIK